ncbi:MAG TPA: dTDP-glucose 4,6-dehydratase [Candidatus Marinimicrobia bacterium]|nr:dTDP-glucose 4,6-dehydratase [Candidatus Neomarinimicrobiota bacterium]
MKTYLITGGCGFIGSNFVRYLLTKEGKCRLINLDKLTYAGNPKNLSDVDNDDRYIFVHGDICDEKVVDEIFSDYHPDIVFNFAAESHVDRSIGKPDDFIRSDMFGVFTLLEAMKLHGGELFVQISTDEVYGSIEKGEFTEEDPLMPSNPYSASKAGGDRLAYSYFVTYDLPVIVTRASNNYGPFQYPEKLIPLFVTNALEDQPLPLYGDGKNVRDWLYVEDHCSALHFIMTNGVLGETYNIGGGNEMQNIEITRLILDHLSKSEGLIRFVEDRKGHDQRYALSINKLRQLGWEPKHDFTDGLRTTIDWYVSNNNWWRKIKSGEFREYYEQAYNLRAV